MLTELTLLAALPIIHAAPLQPTDPLPRRGQLGLGGAAVPATLREQLKLEADQGILATAPVPGLTADKAGVKANDIILALNGKPISVSTFAPTARELPSGKELTFKVLRDGEPLELKAILNEKPRDPGNANYTVTYSHVVSHGQRMRTIITKPKKPGKHPGFLFIQGYSPVSYDFTLEGSTGNVQTLDGPILFDFANSNFVTMRVEKPGVGDSEGGPFSGVDCHTEMDIYRQAMKQLKEQGEVDVNNIFIFGHSMGGAFGPMLAAETPIKGICVYGTASRTWMEYLIDSIRYQNTLAGATPEAVDEDVRLSSRIFGLVMHEKMSAEEVKKAHPSLAPQVDGMFPGGMFNAKTLEFWRQLGQVNFPAYWAKCNAHVLSVWGENDFVTFGIEHQLIADTVNRVKPGTAKYVTVPKSDHLFHDWDTQKESQQKFGQGKYNPAFSKLMMEWMREVMAKPN